MADNLTPVLNNQTHIPLAEAPAPAVQPKESERAEVLNTIADIVSPDGHVDLNAIDDQTDAEGTALLTAGELDLSEGDDPFVTTATDIAQDRTMSLQDKFTALKSLDLARQDGETPEHKARSTMIALEEEGAENFRQERRARIVGEQIQKANSMQRILDETRVEIDKGFEKGEWLERTTEFVASELLPTGWVKSGHFDPARFLHDLVGIEIGALDYVVLGDKLDEAREVWATFSPEEQERRARQAKGYIMERAGTFQTDNKWESDRLMTMFAGVVGNVEQYDAAKQVTFFEPIINLATLGVGGAAVRTGKSLVKGASASAPIKIIAEAAPESSKGVVQAAINDVSGETAQKLGARREEVIEDYQLHNTQGDPVLRGPDVRDNTVDVEAVTAEITKLRSQHNLATPEEIEAATIALSGKLDKVDNIVFSQSEVYRDLDNSLKTKYRIRPDDGPEFPTFREAQEFVGKKLEPYQMDSARILKYDADQKQYLPVERIADIDEAGGYLVEVDYRQTLNNIAKPENVFRRDRVTWADGHLDTTVTFTKRTADAITGVEMTTGQVEKILTDVIKPFKSLPRGKQLRVEEVLKEGADASKEFNRMELIEKFDGDMAQVKAYNAYRDVYDINHGIRNVQLRDHLQSSGHQQLTYGAGLKAFLKPDTSGVRSAWDAKTGKMVDVPEGATVYKTFSPLKYTDEAGDVAATSHVLVDPSKLGPISPQVLPKITGYMGTHLDAKWLIKKRVTGSNGQFVDEVVRFGKSSTELKKAADEMGPEYDVYPTREADTGQFSISDEAELMADLEMLGHTKARSDLNKINDSYRKHLMDPSVAIARDITTMSRQAGLQETTKYLVNKWNKTYGKFAKDGQMPWGKFEIPAGLNTADRAEAAQAQKLHQRIKIMSGMDDETIAGRFKAKLLSTADAFSTMAIDINKAKPDSRVAKVRSQFAHGIARGAEVTSDIDLIAKAKELNFLQFIVFAPARQAVLQAATSTLYTGVEGGVKYAMSGKWGRDIAFLARAKMSVNPKDFDRVAKRYAKMSDMSPAEAKRMFEEFDNSGLLQSISNHQYMEYASAQVIGRKFGLGSFKRAAEKGFQIGESTNLMSAYAIMRNKYVNNTGRNVFSEDEIRQIAIEAKQLAGNMGNANKAAFQQGFMGVPFQFMSHNVKMLQLMAPPLPVFKNVQLPVISNAERKNIAIAYGLMWGTGGLAVSGLALEAANNAGIPIDDDVMNVVEEGLVGWSIEASFEAMAGDNADVDVSGSFGPLAGVPGDLKIGDGNSSTPIGAVAEFMHSTYMNSTPPLHELLGASGRLLDDPTGSIQNAVMLWDTPSFSVGEKAVAQVQNLTTFFPVINEWYQARAAANIGKWVNSKGDPVTEASYSEALAKGILGIEPEAKEAIYNFRTMVEGRPSSGGDEGDWAKIKTSGKDQARFIASTAMQLDNGVLNHSEFYGRIETAMIAAKMAFPDPVQYNVFKHSMRKEVESIMKAQGTTIEEGLFRKLAGDKWKQGETSKEKMFVELKKLPSSEARDMMLEKLPQWFGAGQTTGTSRDVRE